MISTNAKNQIINKLREYNIICNRFMCVVALEKSYPEYIISATLDDKKITLHLISCVHDKKLIFWALRSFPDSDRKDEILSFSVSVAPDDLYAISESITNKYIEKELLEVDKINNDFPFKVDYQVALFYEFFCFVTGTLVYKSNSYDIMTLSEYPTCMVGAYAHNPTARFYSKELILLSYDDLLRYINVQQMVDI